MSNPFEAQNYHETVPFSRGPEEDDGNHITSQPVQNRSVQNQPVQYQAPHTDTEQYCLLRWHQQHNYMMNTSDLANRLGVPNILRRDLLHLGKVSTEAVASSKRACAEQLARSSIFFEWLRAPASSQLLVHANCREGSHISGLSLFCAHLAKVLREKKPTRFIPLVFFCGLHTDRPDNANASETSGDVCIGGRGLLQSFIHQLLDAYYYPNGLLITVTAQEMLDIENRRMAALYGLFRRLVLMLPSDFTVCCLVDGVMYYERDEFLGGMERVVPQLLQLSRASSTPGPLKVLLTSPTHTSVVREWFAEESILSMTEMDRAGLVSDAEGLERRLASIIG